MPEIIFIAYICLYIASGSMLTVVISHLWINRKLLHLEFALPLLISIWVWYSTQLLEYILVAANWKLLLNRFQYLGVTLLPAAWYYFCFKFSLKRKPFALGTSIVLIFSSLLFFLLYQTNSYHHFMWLGSYLHTNAIHIINDFAPGQYLFVGYTLICVLLGFRLLVNTSRLAGSLQRRQILILIGVSLVPFLSVGVDFFLLDKVTYIRISPVLFSISSLIILYFARLRYFRTIPLSQHVVIESMHDVCIILNPENQIIYCNPSVYNIFLLSPTGVIGKPLTKIFFALRELVENSDPLLACSNEVGIAGRIYDVGISPILNRHHRMINRVLVMRDITRLKQTQESLRKMTEQLEELVHERTEELKETNSLLIEEINERKKTADKLNDSLKEKDILLGEVHHRVKNNLQVIISLLKLQKKELRDPRGVDGFNIAISRIKTIAIIHEKLYKSEDLASTNLGEYIKDLATYLLEFHRPEQQVIKLEISVAEIMLDLDRSILCGLIMNELIINAIKYAFPPEVIRMKPCLIEIFFNAAEDSYTLGVRDNGIGMPADIRIEQVDSLGLKIVATLVKQLSGLLTIERSAGTSVFIKFAKPPDESR